MNSRNSQDKGYILFEEKLSDYKKELLNYENHLAKHPRTDDNSINLKEHLRELRQATELIDIILVDGDGNELFKALLRMDTQIEPLNNLQAEMCGILSDMLPDENLENTLKELKDKLEAAQRYLDERKDDDSEPK
jgi:NAD kinase